VTLAPGDRLALTVVDGTITSYAHTDGGWKRLRSNEIGDVVGAEHRYGFGLRGSGGSISLAGFEGRSR
jgi:hypothetical protein